MGLTIWVQKQAKKSGFELETGLGLGDQNLGSETKRGSIMTESQYRSLQD